MVSHVLLYFLCDIHTDNVPDYATDVNKKAAFYPLAFLRNANNAAIMLS
jgi:hypothetical protein